MTRSRIPAKWRSRGTALFLLALAVPWVANAAAPGRWLSPQDHLAKSLLRGQTREAFVETLTAPLAKLDRDGDGLDRADVAWLEESVAGAARARAVSSMLSDDSNGDLRVTMEELNAHRLPRYRDDPIGDTSTAHLDADADGVITLDEAVRVSRIASGDDSRVVEARILMALDPARDGRLTLGELRTFAEETFRDADGNGDGVLSPEEAKPFVRQNQARLQNPPPPAAHCVLPRISARDQLILIGVDQSEGYGPPGVSNRITVTIEPGAKPLYLILSSEDPVAWRFVGDVGRVAHAVMMSRRLKDDGLLARAEGLPSRVVQLRTYRHCVPAFRDVQALKGQWSAMIVRDLLGRAPDGVFAAPAVIGVSAPSGRFERWRPPAQAPEPRSAAEDVEIEGLVLTR